MKEKTPQFIREFSKGDVRGHDAEELQEKKATAKKDRGHVAQEFWAKRAEYAAAEEKHIKSRGVLNERHAETQKSREELAGQLERIRGLERELLQYDSTLRKVSNFFRIRALRADLEFGHRTYEELKAKLSTHEQDEQSMSAAIETQEAALTVQEQEAKQVVDMFYAEQKKQWEGGEYTQAEMTEYLSEEHLASLSLDEYKLLLRRFPGGVVTHVTRQGVRDHVGMFDHSAGEGKFGSGFTKILEAGRLRSAFAICIAEHGEEEGIKKFLSLDTCKNRAEALRRIEYYLSDAGMEQRGYADRSAIHFATAEVADAFYGAETENEIFIVYPSAHIASQYHFQGQLAHTEGNEPKWNDQWVWANEERGMDINAGVVFIPADAKVDPDTGSKYALDKDKKPLTHDEVFISKLEHLIDSGNFNALHEEMRQLSRDNAEILRCISMIKDVKKDGKTLHEFAITMLQRLHAYYMPAQNTITSQEFWELYFAKHPKQRPSKIVYYTGGDPTAALQEWSAKPKLETSGFSEHQIHSQHPMANIGLARWRSIATQLVDEAFPESQK